MAMAEQLQPPQTQARQPGREREMIPAPDFTPRFPGVGKLRGQVALITGGDSGIGRAVAVAMAREGARIAFAYLNAHGDARDTPRLIQEERPEERQVGKGCVRTCRSWGVPE